MSVRKRKVLTEDASVTELGDGVVTFAVQCTDLRVISFILKPKARDAILGQFKKGTVVQACHAVVASKTGRWEIVWMLNPNPELKTDV